MRPRLTAPLSTPLSAIESRPLNRPPDTTGRVRSPCSNPTSTSSLTSGRNVIPRLGPPPTVATRAQLLSTASDSAGNLSFTIAAADPLPVDTWVTTPTIRPSCGAPPAVAAEAVHQPGGPAVAGRRIG